MNKQAYLHYLQSRKASNKTNYYLKSLEEIKQIKKNYDHKPKILVHACCAVCSSWPLEFLSEVFEVTIFFNNSNIYPSSEYERRLEEMKRYIQETAPHIQLIVTPYDNETYTKQLEPMKDDPEGFGRCFFCYAKRMNQAYAYANENGYDYFTTVMSVSRQKDSQKLNEIGRVLSKRYPNTKYFYSDFKKKNGQVRKEELSNQHELYHQDYCGCIYSYNERNQRLAKKQVE